MIKKTLADFNNDEEAYSNYLKSIQEDNKDLKGPWLKYAEMLNLKEDEIRLLEFFYARDISPKNSKSDDDITLTKKK